MSFLGGGDVTHVDVTFVGSLLQVLSNLAYLVDAADFLRMHAYYAASLALAVFFHSSMYHLCEAQWYCFSLTDNVTSVFGTGLLSRALERLRLLDHITSNNGVGGTILIAAFSDGGGGKHIIFYQVMLFFVVAYSVFAFPFQLQEIFIMVVYLTLVIVFEYLVVRRGRLPPGDRFHVTLLVIGLVWAGVGAFLYFSTSFIPPEIAHAIWHLATAIAINLVVRAVNHRRLFFGDSDAEGSV